MAFYPCILDWVETVSDEVSFFPDRASIKLKDGTVIGAADRPCRVMRSKKNTGDEQSQGQRTTGESEVDIAFAAGTSLLTHYRIHVTYASGATAMFHILEPSPPTSDEVQRVYRCKFVQD